MEKFFTWQQFEIKGQHDNLITMNYASRYLIFIIYIALTYFIPNIDECLKFNK